MTHLAEALKTTIEASIRIMLEHGVAEPKDIHATCNCIATVFEMPLDIVIDMFELILPTVLG